MLFRNAALLTLAAIALAGCGRDDVKVYHVAKEESSATTSSQLQWTLPDGWSEKTPGQMRVASFTVTGTNGEGADVGVIPLPTSGQEIQLVNMWRQQMQLPALTNEITAETVSVGGDSAKFFDIASDALLIDGKFRARILVAELKRGETSWFFKMTGEDAFVESQKENFLQFLKSVSFAENVPALNAASPVPGTSLGNQNFLVPNANTTVIGGANSNGKNSFWTIPVGWQQLQPSSEFLLAEFSINGINGANADVNVAELAGEGGGLLANVNRWRGQLGLPPLAQEDEFSKIVSSIDSSNGKIQLVDFTGTNSKTGKPARLVGAVVPENGQTWFYKLMGDEQVVALQKDAFIKFVQSAKYPNAP
jgi:hypothetical protein